MPVNPTFDRATFLRPIAHRGLHHAGRGVIENTIPAFAEAIRRGYGIECDVRGLRDGTPVVFHDATLGRLVDRAEPLAALVASDLATVRYRGTDQRIATLADLLYLVGGVLPGRGRYDPNPAVVPFETAAPLFIEIKSDWGVPDPVFLANVAMQARAYRGPIAVMSFDPVVVAAIQTLAPDVPRGLVSGSYRAVSGDGWWADQIPPERAHRLRKLDDFEAVGASFAAYEVGALPTRETSALRANGLPVFAWTVRTEADRARAAIDADAAIFEGFCP
jgi:glycerophosphoryl diester phosphodiesterase